MEAARLFKKNKLPYKISVVGFIDKRSVQSYSVHGHHPTSPLQDDKENLLA
jgi:hypothetical protein